MPYIIMTDSHTDLPYTLVDKWDLPLALMPTLSLPLPVMVPLLVTLMAAGDVPLMAMPYP